MSNPSSSPPAEQPFDTRRLCHLLRRTAFGVTPKRLADLRGKKPAEVIGWLLDFDPADDPIEGQVESLEGFLNFTEPRAVASYWFFRMLNSAHQMQERVALFWHGHFATGAGKVDNGRLMHAQ